jgi:hypothetical protein
MISRIERKTTLFCRVDAVRNIPEVVERIISRIERKTNLFGRVHAGSNIPEVVERCCGIEAHIH